MSALAPSRLRRLAGGESRPAASPLPSGGEPASAGGERCDLCAEPIPAQHRHLLDIGSGLPQCACRACVLLFDRGAAGGDSYRLIGERRARLPDDAVDGPLWASVGIPVELAFVLYSTPARQALAFYPSPLGVTRHPLARDSWEALRGAHQLLAEMEPDVEALLVRRTPGARAQWLVPIDDCYRLVARIRRHWSGFQGGDEVWRQIAEFFAQLQTRQREQR